MNRGAKPNLFSIADCGRQGIRRDIRSSGDSSRHFLQDRERNRARASAKIEQAAGAQSGRSFPHEWQNRVDKRFGIGTWLQRLGGEAEPQPMELPEAHDAVDRFASNAPFQRRRYGRGSLAIQ